MTGCSSQVCLGVGNETALESEMMTRAIFLLCAICTGRKEGKWGMIEICGEHRTKENTDARALFWKRKEWRSSKSSIYTVSLRWSLKGRFLHEMQIGWSVLTLKSHWRFESSVSNEQLGWRLNIRLKMACIKCAHITDPILAFTYARGGLNV